MRIDQQTCVFVLAALSAGHAAHAAIYLSTGADGAQIQCDVAHLHHWTYSVSQDTDQVAGALFMMKAGSQTTANLSFSIFEGQLSDYGTAAALLLSTLTPSSFTQSFEWIEFSAPSITLLAGHVYTAVLSSDAADSQNFAYFLKGGSDAHIGFVDGDGAPGGGGSEIIPPVPAPGALALLVVAGFTGRQRRRRAA